jgi:hypothetical protein
MTLQGQTVEEVKALTILGLTFDSRLTWQTLVRDAMIKANKRLNILRCPEMSCWDRIGSGLRSTIKNP